MNTLFTPENPGESELFRPLRQMKSPLSMNAVKNYILERIEGMTIWQRIQRLIFQTSTFTAIIASICSINSPAGETKGMLIHPSQTTPLTAAPTNFDEQIISHVTQAIIPKNSPGNLTSINEKVNREKPIAPATDKQEIAERISFAPPITTPAIVIDMKTESLSEIIVPRETETSSLRPFAEVQALGIADHTRIYGGGISAGVIHDWQIASVHFMDAGGVRDDRKDDPSLSNISRIKGETGKQFALMFGGIIERGRFSSSLQVGPSYSMSAITSGLKGIPSSNTVLNQNMLGMSAQISAGYRFSDFFSANVEGLFGYRSAFSKGLVMSIMIQP
jgi:hypothetical protein